MAKFLYKILLLSILAIIFIFGFKNPVKAETYDLKAESLVMNSAKCEANQTCVFTARVKNLGGNFTMDFFLNSSVSAANYKIDSPTGVAPARGTVIKTNDYITFTINGVFSKIGQVDLTFKVDPAGYFTESDMNNNSIVLKVNVIGYDLAAESVTMAPIKPAVKQNCYIRVKVKNNSSYNLYGGAGTDLVKSFPDFSITKASSTMPSLANLISNGGYLYYEYEGNFFSAGDKKFSFTIDPNDDLKEADTANNTVNATFSVFAADATDLAIDSVSLSSSKIIMGDPLDITIGVKNIGKTSLTDAAGIAKTEFIYNLPYFDYGINYPAVDTYPTLTSPFNPGDIFHYKFHGAFNQPGNFNLAFSINKSKQLTEANLDNDATTTPVMVYKSLALADNFSVLSKSVSFASSTTAIVNWKTDVKTTGQVNYNLAHNNVNDNKIEDTNSALEHAVSINNLKSGENYSYSITAKNGIVEKTELISNFSMPEDNILKITAGPSVAVNDKIAVFGWSTNLISSGRVYYKKPGANDLASAGLDTAVADHRIELKDLAYSQYDYYLSSTSTPGTNIKTDWASFEVKAAATSTPTAQPATAGQNSQVQSQAGKELTQKLLGKIILKPPSQTELYYFDPKTKIAYYLTPENAFAKIKKITGGVSNKDLAKLATSLANLSGADADKDGLPDDFELAIGTNKNKKDTDGDKFSDKDELLKDFSPVLKNKKLAIDKKLTEKLKGKFLLQTQSKGQVWYVNPADGKKYFINAKNAFAALKSLAVKISESDFAALSK